MAVSVRRVQQQLRIEIGLSAAAGGHPSNLASHTQVEDFSTYVGRLQTPRELMIMMVGRQGRWHPYPSGLLAQLLPRSVSVLAHASGAKSVVSPADRDVCAHRGEPKGRHHGAGHGGCREQGDCQVLQRTLTGCRSHDVLSVVTACSTPCCQISGRPLALSALAGDGAGRMTISSHPCTLDSMWFIGAHLASVGQHTWSSSVCREAPSSLLTSLVCAEL